MKDVAQRVEEENEGLIRNRQGVYQIVKWSVWRYVYCRKLGDRSSPDAADAYSNRHQVGNLNYSEVDDGSVEVQSDVWL